MQQHRAIKQKYPDAILLFHVGDFYETFGEDAIIASRVLGITLTRRNNGAASSSELAGFPHHAPTLTCTNWFKAGYRVAIATSWKTKAAKGVVKRGVTEMVTRVWRQTTNSWNTTATIFGRYSFLTKTNWALRCSIYLPVNSFAAEGDEEYIDKLLQSLKPAEVVFSAAIKTF